MFSLASALKETDAVVSGLFPDSVTHRDRWAGFECIFSLYTTKLCGAVLVELLMEAQDHRPGCLPQISGVPGLEGMDAGVVGSVAVLAVALWMAGERVELGKQALHSDTRNRGIAQFLQSPDVDPPPALGMPAVALDSDRVAASVAGFRWAAALSLPPCPYMHA